MVTYGMERVKKEGGDTRTCSVNFDISSFLITIADEIDTQTMNKDQNGLNVNVMKAQTDAVSPITFMEFKFAHRCDDECQNHAKTIRFLNSRSRFDFDQNDILVR